MPDSGCGSAHFDIVVVGGGIVGLATARALLKLHPSLKLVVLEKEQQLARHQTGHNSGVIHSGLYYRPGSAKAKLCVAGRDQLYRFCATHQIPHVRCGKVVVASHEQQLGALEQLESRGVANGLQGVRRLTADELREYEPCLAGIAGLLVPETGVVDFTAVAEAMAREIRSAGGQIKTGCRLEHARRQSQFLSLLTSTGPLSCSGLINCAGLHSDRVCRMAGGDPGVRIIPFRGEYFHLQPSGAEMVKALIYPVPDPSLPFLGVHFTRGVDNRVEAGPNAVLALAREGYRKRDISLADCWETLAFPGFWKLAGRFWQVGLAEYRRSFSRRRFLRDLQLLIPGLSRQDLGAYGSGVRAQAVDRQGKLLDDFSIITGAGMVHVLNAPSPAATASLAIGDEIARLAEAEFRLA
jgi:(S)-2-hydroxyglutarate dehydrogenase